MASAANCARCLTRPTTAAATAPRILSQRIVPVITAYAGAPAAPFSTSSADAAPRTLKMIGKHIRRGKINQNSKKKRDNVRVKKPAPGERKAFRKRITLSNNNALAVEGLKEITNETLAAAASKGSVVGLPDKLVDQLRTLEAFKTTQNWGLFRRPHMLVREETVKLASRLDAAVKEKQTLRLALTGGKIAGKSMLLLQAMAHSLMNNWVVINIPEGIYLLL